MGKAHSSQCVTLLREQPLIIGCACLSSFDGDSTAGRGGTPVVSEDRVSEVSARVGL